MDQNEATTKRQISKWFLFGVSVSAKKKPLYLKFGENRVGKNKTNEIFLPSTLCSGLHCTLTVNNDEIILRDKSKNGTYVNQVFYKNSRHILSDGDVIGFGCKSHNFDPLNKKNFVYRVKFQIDDDTEIISVSDDDEHENKNVHIVPNFDNELMQNSTSTDGNETDEGEPIDNDIDIKPNIYTLMQRERMQSNFNYSLDAPNLVDSVKLSIKEEVAWLSNEYEKEVTHHNSDSDLEDYPIADSIDLCDDSDDDVIIMEENKSKRRREEIVSEREKKHARLEQIQSKNKPQLDSKNSVFFEDIIKPELLKVKVKNCQRSRGQQLALDMLGINLDEITKKTTAKPSTSAKPIATNHPKAELFEIKKNEPISTEYVVKNATQTKTHPAKIQSADSNVIFSNDVINEIVSEITGWHVQWLLNHETEPPINEGVYRLDQMHINFVSMAQYQRAIKSFLLLELYSLILREYNEHPTGKNLFCTLISVNYADRGANLKRYVYRCEADDNHARGIQLLPNDYVMVSHSRNRFLAYVTCVKRSMNGGSSVLRFEVEATEVLTNKSLPANAKYLSIKRIKNIRPQLECFIGLKELTHSPLCEAILRPSYELDMNNDANNIRTSHCQEEVVTYTYEQCAVSLASDRPTINVIEGGTGTGKSKIACDLITQLMDDAVTGIASKSVLVCGVSNTAVDELTLNVLQYHTNIVRFGNLASMSKDVHCVAMNYSTNDRHDIKELNDADIVFITLSNAIDLLRLTERKFNICIMDEASSCTETDLLPIFRFQFGTFVMLGDEQLQSSTTINEFCRNSGFGRSFFSRTINSYKQAGWSSYPKLRMQYRMHPEICHWPNTAFYNNKLMLTDGRELSACPIEPYTVFRIDTYDDREIDFVEQLLVECMKYADPEQFSYGIIAGHMETTAQLISQIKSKRQFARVAISSCDCFQGDEKDIIIISAMKSIKFDILSKSEIINVALTRARQALIICGNFQFVETSLDETLPLWVSFLTNAEQRKRLFSVNGDFRMSDIMKKILKKISSN